ncbi:hypothetical protein [Xanthomonas albilineans]|uniref:hypothetical protein n=1 Tax=Xanthomonas albilineans TaxID=29447 RepID=UPI001E63AAF9|nr:hypothetical protein [Xanthomonas albilineans]
MTIATAIVTGSSVDSSIGEPWTATSKGSDGRMEVMEPIIVISLISYGAISGLQARVWPTGRQRAFFVNIPIDIFDATMNHSKLGRQ